MYVTTDYAQSLRAIGQALEVLSIEEFEMEPIGETYCVRGVKGAAAEHSAQQQLTLDKLRSIWGRVADPRIGAAGPRPSISGITSRIELNYTREDVERLDSEGRNRRGHGEGMADSASLSQLLRCIGAYLTQKVARLVRISWQGDALAVEYETSMGSRAQESFAPSDLYDLGIRMYLQRASRANP